MTEIDETIIIKDVKTRFERQEILTKEFRDNFFKNYTFFTKDHITATEDDFTKFFHYWADTPKASIIKYIEKVKKLKSIYSNEHTT